MEGGNMGETIKAIQETPLPTILIIAGLFFLLLGFVNKLGGVIEVSSEQKRLTIPIGLLILTIGLVLSFSSSPELNSSNGSVNSVNTDGNPAESPSPEPTQTTTSPISSSNSSVSQTSEPTPTSTLNPTPTNFSSNPDEVRAVIEDPDGYTNIRSGQGTQFSIIARVDEGEVFYTIPQQDDWWPVRTKDEKYGYIHRSRINVQD
jgi:uncharacterized protein YgiM (DUF1202 family)